MSEQGVPVVVTTEYQGVFFGFLDGPQDAPTVQLRDAQMCVYWSSDVRGVLGLAATGPCAECRVTRPVPAITLPKVTAVMTATEEAVKAWQSCPWSLP